MTLKTALELQNAQNMVWTLLSDALSEEYRAQREWLEENRPFSYDEHDADDVVSPLDEDSYYTEKAIEFSIADLMEDHPEVATAFEIVLRALVNGPFCDYENIKKFVEAHRDTQSKKEGF